MKTISTEFAPRINLARAQESERPLTEYPRPQLRRRQYEILNGIWDYAITDSADEPGHWDGPIAVPFSPESALSGVGRTLQPGQFLHYFRTFTVEAFREDWHLLLHFGAVDERCRVYVNGKEAGSHRGGYLSFTIDITPYVHEGVNVLRVSCQDETDASYHARGKQKLEPGGIFYPAQSGIWQSVWTEWVPQEYIREIQITPLFDDSMVEISTKTGSGERCSASAVIHDGERWIREIHFYAGDRVYLHIPNFHPWTPADPHLYHIEIQMNEDRVESYFAMRKFEVRKDVQNIPRFYLNNAPIFLNGVLDQGYWPESLMTPPSDAALIADVQGMKELGFNTLRKHVKIESERWYYHCDRLGMLVWQDLVNGGGRYNMNFVCNMPNVVSWTERHMKDDNYALFARQDEGGRREYDRDLKGTVRQLYSHPCIIAWTAFNEGWGQFDANRASAALHRLDPTRVIDEASGWFDQRGGNVLSIHNYFRHLRLGRSLLPDQERVVALTEYGGIAFLLPEHSQVQEAFGYHTQDTAEDLQQAYEKLIRREVLPNIARGLSAAIYTQLSDVEQEVNGLYTYDRRVLKVDRKLIRRLNRRIDQEFADATAWKGNRNHG